MTELRIPAAGDAVTEVQLNEWVVADGATVKEGDLIYTVETEKSIMEIQAPASGKLTILVQAGETLEIGHLVGRID